MTRAVLIIGAGPAGLSAACSALDRGASVTLLDAADQLGGQFWRHAPATAAQPTEARLQHGWHTFSRLREALEADPRCRVLTSAHVWAIEPGSGVTVHALLGPADGSHRAAQIFRPDALVLATGAHDRTLPFPGWDLPGVYTAGAAQALAKSEGVALGARVVLAGAGPFLLPVAASLTATGAEVLGIFEASPVRRLASGWLPHPWQLLSSGAKAAELAGYVGHQLRRRIPYFPGHAVVAAHGNGVVDSVTVARVDAAWSPIAGTERRLATDAVCVSHAFTPRLELPIAAGCRIGADGFVAVDDHQSSTVAGVYAAGEITGIAGADAALAEGAIAGHCAAGGTPADPRVRGSLRARARARQFAGRMAAAHGIGPGWPDWLTDETLVCRCEEVSYGRFRKVAAETPDAGLRSLKLSTRVCLGPCQGRICGRNVADLLGRDGSADHRPIAIPIRLGELAQDQQQQDQQQQDQHETAHRH